LTFNNTENDSEEDRTAEEDRRSGKESWERRAIPGSPRKHQQLSSKPNLPGPFSSFQMTITAICYAY
jgi:hypothetical protein